MNVPVLILCFFVVILEHFQRWNDAPRHRLLLSVNGSNRDLSEEIQLYPCFLKQHHAWTLQPSNADHSYQLITSGSDERKMSIKLVPRVLSFTNMAAGIEKTLGTRLNVIASRFWIAHLRYIKILTWLGGFLVIFPYLVWFSLCSSLFWELRDNGVEKN